MGSAWEHPVACFFFTAWYPKRSPEPHKTMKYTRIGSHYRHVDSNFPSPPAITLSTYFSKPSSSDKGVKQSASEWSMHKGCPFSHSKFNQEISEQKRCKKKSSLSGFTLCVWGIECTIHDIAYHYMSRVEINWVSWDFDNTRQIQTGPTLSRVERDDGWRCLLCTKAMVVAWPHGILRRWGPWDAVSQASWFVE